MKQVEKTLVQRATRHILQGAHNPSLHSNLKTVHREHLQHHDSDKCTKTRRLFCKERISTYLQVFTEELERQHPAHLHDAKHWLYDCGTDWTSEQS
jgi:hypothetical protein